MINSNMGINLVQDPKRRPGGYPDAFVINKRKDKKRALKFATKSDSITCTYTNLYISLCTLVTLEADLKSHHYTFFVVRVEPTRLFRSYRHAGISYAKVSHWGLCQIRSPNVNQLIFWWNIGLRIDSCDERLIY